MNARQLNFVLGGVALVAIAAAVALALRPAAGPAAVPEGIVAPRGPAAVEPADLPAPQEPGGTNAIAAKVLESGGPRTPKVGGGAGMQRGLASFSVTFDGANPGSALPCVRAAGVHAIEKLGTAGSSDVDPAVAAACTPTGADKLDGRVRVATRPAPGDKPGVAAGLMCDATVSYTLTRGGTTTRQEVRGEPGTGAGTEGCVTALGSVEAALQAKLSAR